MLRFLLFCHILFYQISLVNLNPSCRINLNENDVDEETSLDLDDFNDPNMDSLKNYCSNLPTNPEENSGAFEGDMLGFDPPSQTDDDSQLENALINQRYHWPNGVVPYTISRSFPTQARKVIANAIRELSQKTCVSFVARTNQKDYVHFVTQRGGGCKSYVGKIGGKQYLNLEFPGCVTKGIALHEMMHAIAFHHEQSRTDRDSFVKILWHNIKQGHRGNFDKYGANQITNLGTPYDYNSVMHYSSHAFSKNRQPTIQTLRSGGKAIGNRKGMSSNDIRKIKLLYNCGKEPGKGATVHYKNMDIDGGCCLPAVHNTKEEKCFGICRKTAKCNAYAWNNYQGGTCWLKTSATPLVEKNGVNVGILDAKSAAPCSSRMRRLKGKDIDGGCCLPAVHFTPESKCCDICRSVNGCKAYAWSDYSQGTCWLKTSADPIISKSGVIVGILT